MVAPHVLYFEFLIAFLAGISVGSFVTMASWRLPRGEEIVFKPSHCPHCDATLTVRELFPVLSWLIQRGRCLHCQARISVRYPLTEILLGCVFLGLVIAYGVSVKTLLLLLLATELAILIITDLELTVIPDSVQTAMFFTGVVWDIFTGQDCGEAMVSALVGLAIGLVLHFGYKWLRKKDGLGIADVKFFCVAGVWLPLASLVPFMFIAGVIGTLTGLLWRVMKRGEIFPFGPALAVSLFINVLYPDMLQRLMP